MIIHTNFLQGSDEWHAIRAGKITATKINKFLGGTPSTFKPDLYKLAAGRITGKSCDSDSFKNGHMERGKELEGQAREMYCLINGVNVDEVGFIEDEGYIGASPDGLVGLEGIIEIKCRDDHTFLEQTLSGKIAKADRMQMQFNMLVSGRDWVDYVLFNPNFDNNLVTQRIERDESIISTMKQKVKEVNVLVEAIVNQQKEG